MRKTYLIAAILLLSSVWAIAQTTPSSQQPVTPGSSSPSSTSPSQQPATPDSSSTTTQTTTTQTSQTSTDSSTAIEGCLSGSAGNFTLTDQSGKAWQLAGDTSKLSDHVGHQVRIMGDGGSAAGSSPSSGAGSSSAASSGAGAAAGASGSTFTVKKVKMISSSCPTSK
jgi:cytoskeletal protein RodZ